VVIQSSRNQVLRYLGVDVDAVNWGWLCDKGRFDFEAVSSSERLGSPLVRDEGLLLKSATWNDAVRRAAASIREGLERSGPGGFAVVGGARLTNEDAYAWVKLAKGIIGSDNVDAQLGDGLPAEAVLGLPPATIDDACRPGGLVLLLGPDPKEELPVLFLRLRHAVLNDDVKIVELAATETGTTDLATHSLRYRPGHALALIRALLAPADVDEEVAGVAPEAIVAAASLLEERPVTVVLGRANAAEGAKSIAAAANVIHEAHPQVRFLSALRRANVRGALELGMAPGVLPGRVTLQAGRSWFADHWPTVPEAKGLDAAGILRAASEGKIDTLVLLGADPLADFPDRDLAERGVAGARTVIACDQFLTESVRQADVVMPAAGYAEVDGTTTNLEGRVSTLAQIVTPPGTAQPDWAIAAELAFRLGADLGLESIEQIGEEIETVAPAFAGLLHDLAAPSGADGVLVSLPSRTNGETDEPAAEPVAEATNPAAGIVGISVPDWRVIDPPLLDAYSLRLVVRRKLYDRGTLVQHSPSLAGLAERATLRLHPQDFDRLGIVPGDDVRVTSSRGHVTVAARPDPAVARGVTVLDGNKAGGRANVLIDANTPVTDVRVERP
jgi:NADH-quinone oxidoreductase subunit G